MRVDYFMNKISSLGFYTDCTISGKWINDELIPNECVKFSYKKAIRLIKEHCSDIYEALALDYYNPWNNDTYRSRGGKFIVITHSMIEYVFSTNLCTNE